MNGILVTAICALVTAAAAAQEPALSGLTPEPTPASASSLTPVPTPAPSALSGGKAQAASSGRGASLADVVKLSQEARKGQPPRKSLGTITNDNLKNENVKKSGTLPPTPKAVSGKTAPAKPSGRDADSPVPTPYVSRDDKGRSEQDWRGLVGRQTGALQDGEARVRELETKAKQLENDFYAMSDGNRRDAVVKPAWDKARDDLAKARLDLEAARKGLDDLSEEARKANAPPGWLR